MTALLLAVPPGPADITHPRRALARLALSSAYREAAGGVPTVNTSTAMPTTSSTTPPVWFHAQDVLMRAVVYSREKGGPGGTT
jgi:hypothetical protein